MLKRQAYLERIKPFIDKDIVKVFTGIRRSGKSTLMAQVREVLVERGVVDQQIITINFEDLRFRSKTAVGLNEEILNHYSGERLYLFFDEIQELESWEALINSLRVAIDSDIYLTGSNSSLLSGELATLLAGRTITIRVYPFSFREIVAFGAISKRVDVERAFRDYVRLGGFPFIHRNQLDARATLDYLEDLYSAIILKDIIHRYSIRDVALFEKIMRYLMENMGNTLSAVNLIKFLKQDRRSISNETIYNYIAYAEDSMLLNRVGRENIIGKALLKFQVKLYLTDHGFREQMFGANQRDINRVLENIVYVELLRRGYTVRVGQVGDREIDFTAVKSDGKAYFQVAYMLTDARVIDREFRVFREIGDNFPKYVLSMDQNDFSQEGVIHRNIIDWLLA